MIVIGLGNKARHGKDTAATAIIAHASRCLFQVAKISWADSLRQEASDAQKFYGGDIDALLEAGVPDGPQIPKWVKPSLSPTPEPGLPYGKHSLLLQWWGTEYRRYQDPDYWVKKGVEKIHDFQKKYPQSVVVVPDTRFLNEVRAIHTLGGDSIQIIRRNQDGRIYLDPGRDSNHVSETELDGYNWDYKIESKSAALTGELAITTFEYIRGLRGL